MTPSTVPSRATLKIRPGYVDSPTKSTCVGPGVMQSELGALIVLGDARVDIPVGNVGVALRVPGHVGRLTEVAVHRRQRRIWMPERLGAVGRFLFAPEHPHDAALRVEPDDHVRALVDSPDIVVPIDAHAVRLRPGVETLADLPHEVAV